MCTVLLYNYYKKNYLLYNVHNKSLTIFGTTDVIIGKTENNATLTTLSHTQIVHN